MAKPFARLRGQMTAYGDRAHDVANTLLIGDSTVSHKLNNHVQFTLEEMYLLMDRYGIPYDQMHIFFPRNGRNYDEFSMAKQRKQRKQEERKAQLKALLEELI